MICPPGLFLGTVLGILLSSSFGQNLLRENSCVEYRSISLSPFNASVFSKVVLNGGPGSLRTIEVPSQSTWIPKATNDDMYDTRQRRQNNEKFCVLPTTGEIVFDPIKTNHLDNSTEILCDCFVERRLIRTDRHKDDIVPRCDNKTGHFKALQFYSNGKAQCVDEVTGEPILGPFFYNGTSDKPEECVRAEEAPMFVSSVRGRLNKDSKYGLSNDYFGTNIT
ncbi:hypothetical protein BV898_18974 [Hypsibius exemplaris]|uniref:Thyroglobulin type-1 domain-containing protein n=1 Tax=Hypsibius exemplaris TaxID=2072580 RepID=A0A9X6RNH9_HYPEX|nr:hypothetical protein BV898_18974 [Hypsibius exemplaris]